MVLISVHQRKSVVRKAAVSPGLPAATTASDFVYGAGSESFRTAHQSSAINRAAIGACSRWPLVEAPRRWRCTIDSRASACDAGRCTPNRKNTGRATGAPGNTLHKKSPIRNYNHAGLGLRHIV